MLGAISLPYRILAVVLLALGLLGGGFYAGSSWSITKAEAQRAKEQEAYIAELGRQAKRADALSAQLSQAEGQIVTKTVEVIKYVPKVTTGRLCLDSAAVSVLQPASDPDVPKAPGKPPAESPPALAASDRDVAYWVATANQLYDTCAQRLNTLIGFYSPSP